MLAVLKLKVDFMHRVADKDGIKKTCRGVSCLEPVRVVLISYVNRSAATSQRLLHTKRLCAARVDCGFCGVESVLVKALNPENAGLLQCHN